MFASTKLIAAIIVLGLVNKSASQYYASYTTNVYGRIPFKCYSCTNNFGAAGSRTRFNQATRGCGFGNDFDSGDSNVKIVKCYTFCQKKEVGIYGSKIDVQRTCSPTCQEYNGNTRMNYLIDRVSCCTGNYCNSQAILQHNNGLFVIIFICYKVLYSLF